MMNLSTFTEFFRRQEETSSAKKAKERLQMLIVHQRGENNIVSIPEDMEREMKREIQKIIQKYMNVMIDPDNIATNLSKEKGSDVIAVNVNIPDHKA